MSGTLQWALKEWAIAVEALTQGGDTFAKRPGGNIALLRKDGLRERGGHFQIEGDRAFLLPTRTHQTPAAVKPAYAERVQPVPPGWQPETVALTSWAEITAVGSLDDRAASDRLAPFHIWSPAGLESRWQWQPQRPLTVLLLRVYRLATPHTLPYQPHYGGCRSWLELDRPPTLDGSQPVLTAAAYQRQVAVLRQVLA